MKTVCSISSLPEIDGPICLAIGTFDGVHLGHRHLIHHMKKLGTTVLLTFTNHPSEVLSNHPHISCMTTPTHKQMLLEQAGADFCIIQPFTDELSQMPYDYFLKEIHKDIPFKHLFFGDRDAIGKNREGTPENLSLLGKTLGFTPHYLNKLVVDGTVVSSSRIRRALGQGDLHLAEMLLGRPFSFLFSTTDPYLDAGLLKEGNYLLISSSDLSKQYRIQIHPDGTMKFLEDSPSVSHEQVFIFKKDL